MWGSLATVQNDSKPIVMGIARMDASAVFHDSAVGADSAMSSTVALLAAAQTLAMVRVTRNVRSCVDDNLK